MPVLEFTFGSVGDISTVLHLAWSLKRTLDDASSASEEIAAIISAIDCFACALQGIGSAIDLSPKLSTPAINAVRHSLEICRRLLNRLTGMIETHRRRCEAQHGRRIWKAYWAACAWHILGKADADRLRNQLMDQISAIETILQVMQWNVLSTIRRQLDHAGLEISQGRRVPGETKLSQRFKTGSISFRFLDGQRRAVKPLFNLSYLRFKDMCRTFRYLGLSDSDLAHNQVHEQVLFWGNGRKVWFEVFVYEDPEFFGAPSVLVSPVFHILGRPTSPRRVTADRAASSDLTINISNTKASMGPRYLRYLAFVAHDHVVFEDARVSRAFTHLIEFGDMLQFDSYKPPQIAQAGRMLTFDEPEGLYVHISVSFSNVALRRVCTDIEKKVAEQSRLQRYERLER